jgi:hypothetical protein
MPNEVANKGSVMGVVQNKVTLAAKNPMLGVRPRPEKLHILFANGK